MTDDTPPADHLGPRDSQRYCKTCDAYGDHHTDRHTPPADGGTGDQHHTYRRSDTDRGCMYCGEPPEHEWHMGDRPAVTDASRWRWCSIHGPVSTGHVDSGVCDGKHQRIAVASDRPAVTEDMVDAALPFIDRMLDIHPIAAWSIARLQVRDAIRAALEADRGDNV